MLLVVSIRRMRSAGRKQEVEVSRAWVVLLSRVLLSTSCRRRVMWTGMALCYSNSIMARPSRHFGALELIFAFLVGDAELRPS